MVDRTDLPWEGTSPISIRLWNPLVHVLDDIQKKEGYKTISALMEYIIRSWVSNKLGADNLHKYIEELKEEVTQQVIPLYKKKTVKEKKKDITPKEDDGGEAELRAMFD